jgi:SNF2 family DNA or RNA helicase
MIDWFRHKSAGDRARWTRVVAADGVVLTADPSALPRDVAQMETSLLGQGVDALLHQLDDDGYVFPVPNGFMIPWDAIYDVLDRPDSGASFSLLALPQIGAYSPMLESRNALTDQTFSISIAGWHDGHGRRASPVKLVGAVIRHGDDCSLLSRPVWQLVRGVRAFLARDESQYHADAHRRAWGEIRRLAVAANARLDDFLSRTVVLTPERLEIGLTKSDVGGTRVIEVAPSFANAPDEWLRAFDRFDDVQDRYDIPTSDGIVQVVIIPDVRTVLRQIKRMPGRRVAGSRAEAFVTNPFAVLGEDAARVIDTEQFERAREQAGVLFDRFTAHVKQDALGYPVDVGLLVEQADSTDPSTSELVLFRTDEELGAFIRLIRQRLAERMQLCGWRGYDFELLGDTLQQVEILQKAHSDRHKPRRLVSYADIYDLARYTERIEQIGVDKPYYSPFIARKDDDKGWFPDNVVPVIAWTPEGSTEPIAVPLTDELKDQIDAKIKEAKAIGRDEIALPHFDKPLSVEEAEFMLGAFKKTLSDVEKGGFDPALNAAETSRTTQRPGLIIRANIKSIDYEEARLDILTALPGEPALPKALKADVKLMDHQRAGVAWLRYLFGKSPSYCRGVVLADDMGLGKTLQLLTLIASVFEECPDADPALVVAPLSLLENWTEEVERFFVQGALPVLTAHGGTLNRLRVARADVDDQLRNEGLVKFLNHGWRGTARVVLTTYDTLRDLEFSFAAEKWSIMVCDEAQRIKNPNALVTRAAKKQNVQFRIACTGTPVENTLADLWCLFDFIQPGYLGALNDFGKRYRRPIEAETDEEHARVKELRTKISPQILRRTKKDVAKDLREKIIVEDCRDLPLSAAQRMLYGQAIDLFKHRNDPNVVTPFRNHLALLHYLRLVCVDPRRYGLNEFRPDPLNEYRKHAPKLEWLLSTLKKIRRREEKAIIFCEFRAVQRLLRYYIEQEFACAPDIINGDTSASASHVASRQKRIKAFQSKPGFGAIILSPFAVGFGVNIQAANHVIHYTRTWNPAKEDQATDRAYRIGQTKTVYVYCPVVTASDFVTFDEKLNRLLEHKRKLASDMLNGCGDVAPNEFDLEDMMPTSEDLDARLTLDDALRMPPDYFECLVAVLWQRMGFRHVYRTADSHDDGVDVVALGSSGALIQCKSSTVDGAFLGWNAIKDVVTGEAAYRARHPNVRFTRICVTNQFFNENATRHADLNQVVLYDQTKLGELIKQHHVTMLGVERLLYTRWNDAAAC